jgi:hypothetical protein
MEPVRWGVLGTSKFAREWIVPGMMKSPDVRVAAVGSRTRAKADSFAKALGIPMAYGSYEDLLNDPNVEAIYNPLPNHLHVPMTIAAMRAGKHVPCEKADCAHRRRGGIAQDGSEGIACRRSIYGSTPSPMARSTKIDSRGKFGTDPPSRLSSRSISTTQMMSGVGPNGAVEACSISAFTQLSPHDSFSSANRGAQLRS